ncbi:type VI secretion system tip protein VgrG [Spirosoma panaciterrae]|uniref:type VI secretion system tip protein VgrG n=1 Tax=Spirosoma panaciterrae TaxID=496058 RepID=UPI00037B82D5|nr:type VI secretion system tip protein VgrG [Spirosoma panaciterrae]
MSKAPRTIPETAPHDVVTFDILTGNQPIDPSYAVLSIDINKEVNRIPTARLVIRDGEAATAQFAISNTDAFVPGKPIHIKIGHDQNNVTVFQGVIVKQAVKVRSNGQSELTVECRDAAVRMTLGRNSRYYERKKDSDVWNDLIRPYSGLQTDFKATSYTHPELVQYHVTDWDFLLMRAEANGRLVIVDDGKVSVTTPATTGNPVLQLLYGDTLLEFEAELDARQQWQQANAQAWNYSDQQLFNASSSSSSLSEAGNISGQELARALGAQSSLRHAGIVATEELQEWTNGQMLRSRLAKIRGRARCRGVGAIKPGQVLEIQGVGNRFNGKLFVSAVRHEIGVGRWETHIQFGLPSDLFARQPDIADPPASGLIPPIQGLQIGKVVKLENDPEGQDRILVRLPVLDNNAQGTWARVASLDAGKQRGFFFRPEIGDEVLVGFVNDDPRDAVVLGMLHSRANPAPIQAKDVNHEKGLTTRSKLRVHFNDDTKTITIDTPAGNSLILDEQSQSIKIQDQNQNKITMGPSGIEISSNSALTLQAKTTLTITAQAGLSVSGANVSVEAKGPISLQGATAKLSSPGITELSGSLIRIN